MSGNSLPGGLLGGGIRGAFVVGGSDIQLGPDAAPVVGEQLLARDGATGERLDGRTVLNRYRLVSRRHLGDERCRHTELTGQGRSTTVFG